MRLPDQRKRLVISGRAAGFQGNVLLGDNRVRAGTRVPAGVIPKPARGQGETAPAGGEVAMGGVDDGRGIRGQTTVSPLSDWIPGQARYDGRSSGPPGTDLNPSPVTATRATSRAASTRAPAGQGPSHGAHRPGSG